MKVLALLTLLFAASANADYVDIGYGKTQVIETRFHADNFIIGADSSGNVDLGYGVRDNNLIAYIGLSERYIYGQVLYKNERHSIYDLSIKATEEGPKLAAGFTLLTSDTFGYVIRLSENDSYIGVRKWIK